jgi:hypothetical protein
MIIKTPRSVHEFCNMFKEQMTVRQRKVIPRMIVSILMSFGNPNYSVIARKVLSETRNRSSVSRFYASRRFNPDNLFSAALRGFLESCLQQRRGIWFLVIDGTATRRGGFSKIDNAIKYRGKKDNRKGGYPSTKAHMFLMGILLSPDGTPFPLPALPYYTKDYCKKNKIAFKTQVELAAQMIRDAPVPADVDQLIVLADEYYESANVHNTCAAMGYSYIIPIDSRRCLADKQGHRTAVTLHARGRHLQRDLFRRIVLVEGQEKTAACRRWSEPGRKTKRVYRAHTEELTVAGIGTVSVTFSWKRKIRKGKKSGGETYKVLISNDLTLSVQEIVEYYELRWQIELFFREMKSVVGFNRFRGNSFIAYARFVCLALLAVMFLEWTRIRGLTKTRSINKRGDLTRARTNRLVNCLQNEIDNENIEHILCCFKNLNCQNDGIVMLRKLLRSA